jgi:hypothetical protein
MSKHTDVKRRNFLLTLGLGGAGAAAAVVGTRALAPDSRQAAEPGTTPGKGYQLTEHVRNYYRTTRV